MVDITRVPYEVMVAEFSRVLQKHGFTPEDAQAAAVIFAQNSLAGVYGHGLNRFPRLVSYLEKGEIEETWRVLPMGYWKGSGLSVLMDLMATILSNGHSISRIGTFEEEVGLTQIMIAIDPTKFNTVEQTDAIGQQILEDIKKSEPITEGGEVFYPGERSLKNMKENMELGIPVIDEIWESVRKM